MSSEKNARCQHRVQTQLLREEEIEPTEKVLQNALGKDLFVVYKELMEDFAAEFGMESQWRFYKDGKAWLCKVAYKKKTILWLSIWKNSIKTSFYFTEKTIVGVLELEIDRKIKEAFSGTKPSGKLIPLIVDIEQQGHLADLKAIIKYKKGLK